MPVGREGGREGGREDKRRKRNDKASTKRQTPPLSSILLTVQVVQHVTFALDQDERLILLRVPASRPRRRRRRAAP